MSFVYYSGINACLLNEVKGERVHGSSAPADIS